MASRRMFSLDVLDSDRFAALGFESQALYVQLCLRADDWGFVASPLKVCRACGAQEKAIGELCKTRFCHLFESGVLVVMDWWQNNSIPESRRKATKFPEELTRLEVTKNGSYQLVCSSDSSCIQTVCKLHTNGKQVSAKCRPSLEEFRREEISTEEKKRDKRKERRFAPPTLQEVRDYATERRSAVDPERFVDFYESKGWKVGTSPMRDWKAAFRGWETRNRRSGPMNGGTYDAIGSALA